MTPLSAVLTHLWQSTLFAAVVAAGTLALRRNHAAIRYAAWLAASIKFLVPFAVLTAIGAELGPRRPAVGEATELVFTVDAAGRAFVPQLGLPAPPPAPRGLPLPPWSVVAPIWLGGTVIVLAGWFVQWRRIGAIAAAARARADGREVAALRRLEVASGIATPIRLAESDAPLEPGVIGFIRPVLVWPRAIGDRLDEQQLTTILAHEVTHVRRRDNLTAAIHMIVEAIFWFHPVVWWIGARLIDERERACDEAVVRLGGAREVYAASILAACRACLESPLPCVSGVTGSDLRARIERIMLDTPQESLPRWKQLLVAAVPVVAIAAPIVFGVMNAPRLRAETRSFAVLGHSGAPPASQGPAQFEVASVKPNASGDGKVMIQAQPNGRFTATNVTLRILIRNAYQLQEAQVVGGPSWLDEDRFDIVAKADGEPGDPFRAEQRGQPSRGQLMLRSLLAERFKLETHTEAREMPIYALLAARKDGALGAKLQPSRLDCATPQAIVRLVGAGASGQPPCGIRLFPGSLVAGGASMLQLANSLVAFVGRLVFDRSGLTGNYDFTLTWTPDQIPPGFDKKAAAMGLPPIDPNGASIFTAIQEQLGLKLDAQRGPVDVLVVDGVQRPSVN
jgi:uncharacterized protein (TIGR03435 family)